MQLECGAVDQVYLFVPGAVPYLADPLRELVLEDVSDTPVDGQRLAPIVADEDCELWAGFVGVLGEPPRGECIQHPRLAVLACARHECLTVHQLAGLRGECTP